MKWLGSVVGVILLLSSASAYAQGVGCQRLAERLPVRPDPAIHRYGAGLGDDIIAAANPGQMRVAGEQVVVLLGEQWAWMFILTDKGSACPLEPVPRAAYDRARRSLLGTSA
jgi:hypothetical protein